MPDLDATAIAAIEGQAAAPVYLIYLNLADGALRVTTYGQDITVSGSGDSELDGTYVAWGGQLIDIGDISNSDSGSETRLYTLSGIVTIDTDLINDIGDKSKWQGRAARVWCRIYDETGVTPQGAICAWDTGYMSSVKIVAAPEEQIIQLSVENWRAAFNQASNRTYLGQADYDATDTSAQATIAASNGMRREAGGAADAGAGSGVGPGIGGGSIIGGGTYAGGGGSYGSMTQDGISPGQISSV